MLNITRDTGQFLSVLVHATASKQILEVGTSNGYSTLWLAEAVSVNGGRVTTLEKYEYKIALAAKNFNRSGLSHVIAQVQCDAGEFLANLEESSFDLIFLDSERSEYSGWWPHLRRALRNQGLLVVDNATSHPADVSSFIELVSSEKEFRTVTVPVGNGEFLAVKSI